MNIQAAASTSAGRLSQRVLRQARWATGFYFLSSGMVIATWTARIPAVKGRLNLDDGTLSIGLFAMAAGAVAAMQISGRLVDKFGSARVTMPTGIIMALSLIGPGLAPNVPALVGALFLFGAGHGVVDVAMNAHAAEVQRAYGRQIMASFHAVFSVGGLVGAAVGGLAAKYGASVSATFLSASLVLVVFSVLARPWLLPPGPRPPNDESKDAAQAERTKEQAKAYGPRGVIFILGILGMFCLAGEGAAADWSSVYLHDTLRSSAAFAASAYAVFSIAMATGRLLGDRLADRFGPLRLIQGCGLLASLGLTVGLISTTPVGGMLGFGLFGAGLSCIVPQLFTVTVEHDPQHSGRNLARVAGISYAGFLGGPVIIGAVAELTDLRIALGVPAAMALFVTIAATGFLPKRRGSPQLRTESEGTP